MVTNDMIMVLVLLVTNYGLIYRKNKIIGSILFLIVSFGILKMTSLDPVFPMTMVFLSIINLLYMLLGTENPIKHNKLNTGVFRNK